LALTPEGLILVVSTNHLNMSHGFWRCKRLNETWEDWKTGRRICLVVALPGPNKYVFVLDHNPIATGVDKQMKSASWDN
jgi:hypothetical protein